MSPPESMNSSRSTPGASAATLEHALAGKLVLGIETSCDETAASVVAGGVRVLSNTVASQHELHAEYRGVEIGRASCRERV